MSKWPHPVSIPGPERKKIFRAPAHCSLLPKRVLPFGYRPTMPSTLAISFGNHSYRISDAINRWHPNLGPTGSSVRHPMAAPTLPLITKATIIDRNRFPINCLARPGRRDVAGDPAIGSRFRHPHPPAPVAASLRPDRLHHGVSTGSGGSTALSGHPTPLVTAVRAGRRHRPRRRATARHSGIDPVALRIRSPHDVFVRIAFGVFGDRLAASGNTATIAISGNLADPTLSGTGIPA